jgi:hypothetical protein
MKKIAAPVLAAALLMLATQIFAQFLPDSAGAHGNTVAGRRHHGCHRRVALNLHLSERSDTRGHRQSDLAPAERWARRSSQSPHRTATTLLMHDIMSHCITPSLYTSLLTTRSETSSRSRSSRLAMVLVANRL